MSDTGFVAYNNRCRRISASRQVCDVALTWNVSRSLHSPVFHVEGGCNGAVMVESSLRPLKHSASLTTFHSDFRYRQVNDMAVEGGTRRTSSTCIDFGSLSDSRGKASEGSFVNSSRNCVRKACVKEPIVATSSITCIPYTIPSRNNLKIRVKFRETRPVANRIPRQII
jgi:hypothetical protein